MKKTAIVLIAAVGLTIGAYLASRHTTLAQAEGPAPYPKSVQPTGKIREFTLTAAPAKVMLQGRSIDVWAYNGQVPGPILRATIGDTIRVHFTNQLPQPTTIHWHGIRLPNAMDGVPGVTQPAIPPGGSFLYEFMVKDAGTFWFHPHLRGSEQLARGLYGILIVDDAQPLPYSRELVFVLTDWLLDRASGQVDPHFNTRHDLMHDGRWGSVITANGAVMPKVAVRPGERLRIRLINAANARVFRIDADGMDADVIAFDALYTDAPMAARSLVMTPGNRIDFDVRVPLIAPVGPMRFVDRFGRGQNPLVTLEVTGAPVVAPLFDPPRRGAAPDLTIPRAMAVTETYRLNARLGGPYGIEWTINGQVMRHGDGAGHATHHAAHAIHRFPAGRWAKIRFVNESYRLHPMHIHGQFFRLLTRNGVASEEPHFRDTVLVNAKETVEIALFPQDEGAWMLHCHIQEHAESGMMTLIEVH